MTHIRKNINDKGENSLSNFYRIYGIFIEFLEFLITYR